jgi:hypothetical protein
MSGSSSSSEFSVEPKSGKKFTQFIATIVGKLKESFHRIPDNLNFIISVTSFAFSVGNILAWTAPVGVIIKNSTLSPYNFTVNDEELSYIASSMTIGNY